MHFLFKWFVTRWLQVEQVLPVWVAGRTLNTMNFLISSGVADAPARFATASGAPILEWPRKCVFLVIGVALWAVSDCFSGHVDVVAGRVISARHQPEMGGINARPVLADVVNRGFVCGPSLGGVRNVTNKELVRQAVGFELALLPKPEAFDDYAVTDLVCAGRPIPAAGLFVELEVFGETIKERADGFADGVSGFHAGKKKPTRSLKVKPVHERPQSANELEILDSWLLPFQGEDSVNRFAKGVNHAP